MASYKILNPVTGGDLIPGTTRASLCGWSIASTAGATVNFRDGTVAGAIVASVVVAATSTSNVHFTSPVTVEQGIYVEIAAGSVTNVAVYTD